MTSVLRTVFHSHAAAEMISLYIFNGKDPMMAYFKPKIVAYLLIWTINMRLCVTGNTKHR
jgi:hypothetical protein